MKHTENAACQKLKKKHDCEIEFRTIKVLNNDVINKHFDLGNKSWGAIDFLINCCGYKLKQYNSFQP